jgi:putative ABC transport system permease protein
LYSVISAVLLQPLPYFAPDRLMVLWTDNIKGQNKENLTEFTVYREWAQQLRSFEQMAFCTHSPVTMSTAEGPQRLDAALTASSLFSLAGVSPLLGRTFLEEEERTGHGAVVLGHSVWQTYFGGAPDVVGRSVILDNRSVIVLGVMPPSFQLPSKEIQLWLPLGPREPRGVGFGRLRAGVTRAAAQTELDVVGQRLSQERPEAARNPDHPGFRVNLVPLNEQTTGRDLNRALWILFAGTLLVLGIACANVANLLIARGAARRQEFTVRSALGAGRGVLFRQLVTESIVMAMLGGAVGVLGARTAIEVLKASGLVTVPRFDATSMDGRVLLFAVVLSVLCGVGFGDMPALQTLRSDLISVLREGGRGPGTGTHTRSVQRLLVVTQFALTLVLLSSAGLMVRSLFAMERVDLGFRPQNVLSFRVVVPDPLTKKQRSAFHDELSERLRVLPGVTHVGVISNFFSARNSEATIQIAGKTGSVNVNEEAVSQGFFTAIGGRIKSGRDFAESDHSNSARVAIVNDRFARTAVGAEDRAVGLRIRFLDGRDPSGDPWVTIIGIVENIRRDGLERDASPQVFIPFRQNPSRGADVVIRAAHDPQSLLPAIRREVAVLQSMTPVYRVATLEDRLGALAQPMRLKTILIASFAGCALLLAALGVYALMHYLVSQRTRDIGVRMAIGAHAFDVAADVLHEVTQLMLIGMVLGTILSLLAARAISAMLFGVGGTDLVALGGAVLVLAGVALIASLQPALRAARVNPVDVLRG